MSMYPNREVFANAPLALVAAEIRFTDAARLRQQETRDQVTIGLEERFPFAEPLRRENLTLHTSGPPQLQEPLGVVLKNASTTESVTIMSESLIYETTAYTSFEELLGAVNAACNALVEAKVRPAVTRVGLRYIDEVRVPEPINDVRNWGKWLDDGLLGHLTIGPDEVPVTATQTFCTYDLGEGRGLTFRYAALNQGSIVIPRYLKRPAIEPGPFFVLDFDGFRDFSGRTTIPLSSEVVRDSLSAVHGPCGTAFQRSITDEARMLFRGTP